MDVAPAASFFVAICSSCLHFIAWIRCWIIVLAVNIGKNHLVFKHALNIFTPKIIGNIQKKQIFLDFLTQVC